MAIVATKGTSTTDKPAPTAVTVSFNNLALPDQRRLLDAVLAGQELRVQAAEPGQHRPVNPRLGDEVGDPVLGATDDGPFAPDEQRPLHQRLLLLNRSITASGRPT